MHKVYGVWDISLTFTVHRIVDWKFEKKSHYIWKMHWFHFIKNLEKTDCSKFQLLWTVWAQTLNSLYTLDWWKKMKCSGNGITMAEVCQLLFILVIVIPFPALFREISFFFHQSNVYKIFRVWAYTVHCLSYKLH